MLQIEASNRASLFQIPREEDKKFRMSLAMATSLLRDQVPIRDFVDWRLTSIQFEEGTSRSPLNPESTNRHFVYQAAMFVLSANYIGAPAIASLLSGWPVVGVHPVRSPESVSLWLLKSEMNYLRPSVGALDATATIHSKTVRRFIHPRTRRELRGNGNARDSSPRVVKIARTVSRFRGR